MLKNVLSHIRFHQHTHPVTKNGNNIVQKRLYHIGRHHQRHYGKESGKELVGQKGVHAHSGHIGEYEVYHRYCHGAEHIYDKKPLLSGYIVYKNFKPALLEIYVLSFRLYPLPSYFCILCVLFPLLYSDSITAGVIFVVGVAFDPVADKLVSVAKSEKLFPQVNIQGGLFVAFDPALFLP